MTQLGRKSLHRPALRGVQPATSWPRETGMTPCATWPASPRAGARMTPRFRKTICAVLQRPEAELFYPAGE